MIDEEKAMSYIDAKVQYQTRLPSEGVVRHAISLYKKIMPCTVAANLIDIYESLDNVGFVTSDQIIHVARMCHIAAEAMKREKQSYLEQKNFDYFELASDAEFWMLDIEAAFLSALTDNKK